MSRKITPTPIKETSVVEDMPEEGPTFFTVLFGDYQKAIFNSRCKVGILLEYIRKECSCQKDDVIELCDFEGELKQMQTHMFKDYADAFVMNRENYVLLKMEKNEKGRTKYTPLLNNLEESHPELLEKITNMEGQKTKESKTDRSSSRKGKRNPTHHSTSPGFSRPSSQNREDTSAMSRRRSSVLRSRQK